MAAKYKVHPFCLRFPRMTAEERAETKASISRMGGLAVPIEVWGNQIIDGFSRNELCEELGIDPGRPKQWNPTAGVNDTADQEAELWEYLKALNLHRRHLEKSQRSMIAVMDVTTDGGGRPSKTVTNVTVSQGDAAKSAGVSRKTINEATSVTESGTPELQRAVTDGEVTVSDAAKIVDEPAAVQNAAVKAVRKKKAKTVAAAVAAATAEDDEAEAEPETMEQIIEAKNHAIESFCRGLMAFVKENFPTDEWIDDLGRGDSALQKFKDGCATLRTCKCTGPCPLCSGDGCKRCHDTGRVPRFTRQQMGAE